MKTSEQLSGGSVLQILLERPLGVGIQASSGTLMRAMSNLNIPSDRAR